MFKHIKQLAWFYIWALIVAACMTFANFTGWRILSFKSQQQWVAGGPSGYHK